MTKLKSKTKKPGKAATPPVKKKPAKPMLPVEKELAARLQHLRSTASDVARALLSNLEHDILEVMDVVAGRRDTEGKKKRFKSDVLEQMIEAIDKLSVKPEKGRRKDLKKIEGVVDTITRRIFKKRK